MSGMTPRQRWTLLAAILGTGIVFLDSTVVNVALPRIGRDLPSTLFGDRKSTRLNSSHG